MDKSGIQTPWAAPALVPLLPTGGPHGMVAQGWYLHQFPQKLDENPSQRDHGMFSSKAPAQGLCSHGLSLLEYRHHKIRFL